MGGIFKLKKTTIRTTYLYTGYIDHYKQHFAGMKNTKINTGKGSDTISVTAGKGTKVKVDKSEKDNITKKKPYLYSEEYIGRTEWQFTKTETKHKGHGSWLSGGVGGAIIGGIAGLCCGAPIFGATTGAIIGHNT